jgi:hypothetical protein
LFVEPHPSISLLLAILKKERDLKYEKIEK